MNTYIESMGAIGRQLLSAGLTMVLDDKDKYISSWAKLSQAEPSWAKLSQA